MGSHQNVFRGSTFETLESRVLLTGAFPSASDHAAIYDARGNLDVAYYDPTAHDLLFTQQSTNGAWSTPTVIDNSTSDVGKYVTIAVDPVGGFPAVAYQDSFNSDLRFAQYNGSKWSITVVDKRKTTGINPSLTFDSSGNGYISYYKQNTGDLILAQQKKGKWSTTTLQSAGNVGQYSSIVIDPETGAPAVAYSNSTGAVSYTLSNGKSFSKPTAVGNAGGSADVSLAFAGNTPAIGYVTTGGSVELAQQSGKSFSDSTAGTVTGNGSSAQVLIDPKTDLPQVVYADSSGVFIAQPSTGGFATTQVSTSGDGASAVVQPGSGSVVISTIDTNGGQVSVQTNTPPPAAPSMVAATTMSSTSIVITWQDNATDAAGYLIERSTDGVNFTTVTTTGPTATSYTDTGLTEATLYLYRVSAVGAAGSNSAGTTGAGGVQIVPAAGIATATTLPAAPSGLVVTTSSASAISLSWTNNSHAATGFMVKHSTDGGTTWTQIANVGANVTTYSDTALAEDTNYAYEVIAYNVTGGTASTSANATTLPAAPTNVMAFPASTTSITVGWHNNSPGAVGFEVQRSTDDVNFTTITTVPASSSGYTDSAVTEASSYYYRIIANGPTGEQSAASSAANAVTNPNAPSSLSATALSPTRINLTWMDNSTNAVNVLVQRSANGGAYATIATLAPTVASYADSGLTEGISYSYRVQAISAGNTTATSATISAQTLPAAPSNLTAASSGLTVNLTWLNNSASATSFTLMRSADGGNTWQSIGPVPVGGSTTVSYTDSTVTQGNTYVYQVAAVNAAGASTYTSQQSATIVPNAPTGLVATAASATEIDLQWVDNSLGETGIYVERSADGGTTWTEVATTSAFATGYSDTNLTAGTSYSYRISAINAGGASGYSTATGLTAPVAPSGITAIPVTMTSPANIGVDLTWNPVATATQYLVQRSTDGVHYTSLPTTTTASFNDLNLTEGTQYYYTITAINAGGSSVVGGPVSLYTTPAAPSNVTASDLSATSVLVSWRNNSNGATGFVVQRSSDMTNWTTVATPTVGTTAITDSTASESTTYSYRVSAVNTGGASSYVTGSSVLTIPATPTNVVTTPTSSGVSLTWNNISQHATATIVQVSSDGQNFTQVAQLAGNASSYTDTTAASSQTLYYRVYCTDATGASDYSNVPSVLTFPSAPQAPTPSVATTSTSTVSLTWPAVATATSYDILRSTDGSTFTQYQTSSNNSFTDSNASESTQYWYEIEAVNASGTGVASASATATTYPAAPSALQTTVMSATQIQLSWTNNSHNVSMFLIERSSNNGTSFSQVGTAAGNATTYNDTVSESTAYIYRIRAQGPAGNSSYSSPTGGVSLPSAPTGLTLTENSATSVTLNWTNVSQAATGYDIDRSLDGGNTYSYVASVGGNASTYTDTTAPEGSAVYYEVRATSSVNSNTVYGQFSTPAHLTTYPAAPTSVQATAQSPTGVQIMWTNQSAHQTGFNVYRSTDNSTWGSPLNGSPVSGTSYTDTTASPGTHYYYTVVAIGTTGELSAIAPSTMVTSVPATPTGVQVTNVNNPTAVVTWSDVAAETGFTVQRSSNGGTTWTTLGTTSQGVTTYTDTTAVEDTMYQYRVSAKNANGSSNYSSGSSLSTYLNVPTALSVTSTTTSQVAISWTDNSNAASGYEVQRSTNGGVNWQSITTSLPGNATTYTDTGLTDGTGYWYQVRALSAAGNSNFSVPTAANTVIATPTNVTASAVSTSSIRVNWTNASATATGFQIYRSTNGGASYQYLAAVGNVSTYTDTSLTAGQTASYEVKATISSTSSAASGAASSAAIPAAPTGLAVNSISNSTSSLALTWTGSTGATGYQIWRSTGGSFSLVTTTNTAGTTYTDTGLTEGTGYLYKVAAVNVGGTSSLTSPAEGYTYCAAPSMLVATSTSSTSISLSWTDNSANASGYTVMISTDGTHYSTLNSSLLGNATNFVVTGLTEATTYEFEVNAYNSAGPSASTSPVSQTTLPVAPTLASATAESDGIHISWQNNSQNATGFIVRRLLNGGATQDVTVSSSTTSYVDSSGNPNTTYTYEILATGVGGNSVASNSINSTTFPAAPSNLIVSSPSSTSVSISWTPNTYGAGSYDIYRSTDGTNFTSVLTPGGAANGATDSTVSSGTAYKYEIVAINSSGASSAITSGWVTVRTAAPSSINVTSTTSSTAAISWSDIGGENGFSVERSTDDVNWTQIATTQAGITTYADTNLAEATVFYYRVAGSNVSGVGAYTSGVSAMTTPSAPVSLQTTPSTGPEVNLAWTNTSQNAAGIDIYRQAGAGSSVLIAQNLAPYLYQYSDTSVQPGVYYTYTVEAYDAGGFSAAATATALTFSPAPASLQAVANSSTSATLTWQAATGATDYTVMRSPNGVSNWQSLGDTSGALTFTDNSLSSGTTYYYEVTSQNSSGAGGTASTNVLTLPAPVTNFTLASPNATTVNLSWTDSSGATAYNIYRSTDGGTTFSALTTINNPNAVSYTDTVNEGTAYTYRIIPQDSTGPSQNATDASITTVPATPTLTSATAASATTINLQWTNNSAHATGFIVKRSPAGMASWTTLTQSPLASSATTYSDTTCSSGTSYQYEVIAVGAGGNSAPSSASTALTDPAAVTTLSINPASISEIDLTWTDVTGAANYNILRSTDGVNFTQLTQTGSGATSYQNTGLPEGSQYYYQVQAVNASGTSATGNTQNTSTLPLAPSGLTLSVASSSEIDLSWTNNSTHNPSVNVERSTDNSTWTQIASLTTPNVTTYADTTALGGTTYYYRISSVNQGGTSYMHDVSSVSALTYANAPVVTATAQIDGTMSVSWTTPQSSTDYTVQRSADGVNWTTLVNNSASTSLIDSGLTGNTSYEYRALSINPTGVGAYGTPATTLTVPDAPSSLVAAVQGTSQINLSWTGDQAANVTFSIYRTVGSGPAHYVKVADVTNAFTYQDTGLSAGVTYGYEVTAHNASGANVTPAISASVVTVPAAPTNLTATPQSTTNVALTWSLSAGATGYNVYRSTDGVNFTLLTNVALGANAISYSDTTASAGITYTYEITAFNSNGYQGSTISATLYPATPSNFSATVINNHTISLSWTADAGSPSYTLQGSTNLGQSYYNVTVSGTTATDTVAGGGVYYYRLLATNATGTSGYATSETATVPDAPTLSVNSVTASAVSLSWTASAGVNGYTVYRSADGGMTFPTSFNVSSSTTSYTDTSVADVTAYQYEVVADSANGNSVPSSTQALVTLPNTPTSLAASSVSSTAVALTWTDNTAGTCYYNVQRSSNGGSTWTTITQTSTGATSYTDSTASAGTSYEYQVIASNGTVTSLASSALPVLTTPAAPTVTATPQTSAIQVNLTWGAETGATSYTILREPAGGSFSQIATGISATSYQDSGVSGGTSYTYEVEAVNTTGAGPVGTSGSALTIPAAAGDFTASATSDIGVNLAWDQVLGATTYTIERKPAGGSYQVLVPNESGQATAYSDNAATPATNYTYEIIANDATGSSFASTNNALTLPAPVAINSSTVASNHEIDLAWTDDSGVISGYRIYRSSNGGVSFNKIGSDLSASTTSFADTSLSSATGYIYRVLAFNGAGVSTNDDTSTLTTFPDAPSGFSAAGASNSTVNLSWSAVTGATGYVVQRQNLDGSWSTASDQAGTTFQDSGLSAGTSYNYRVEAFDVGGISSPSSVASGLTSPATPTDVSANVTADTSVSLTWDAMQGAASYNVTYSTDGGNSFQALATGDATNSYTFNTASPATSYIFDVVAVNATGSSGAGSASATTIPAAPTGLSAQGASSSEIDLAWTDSTGATGYEVDRYNSGSWAMLTNSLGSGATSYADTTAASGTTYTYRVEALDSTGPSLPTATVTGLTAPGQTTNIVATPASVSEVDLAWTAVTGAASYTITYSTNGGNSYQSLASNVQTNSYADTSALAGTSYLFKVLAVNATGNGAIGTSNVALTIPAAQSDFNATSTGSTDTMLNWTDVTGATSYTIERETAGGSFQVVTSSLTSVNNTYHDTGLSTATAYTYEIFGTDATGNSAPTQISILTKPGQLSPTATVASSSEIDLSWSAASGTIGGYRVYRSTDGGNSYSQLGSDLSSSTLSYQSTGLTSATNYYYYVVAFNTTGVSSYSPLNATSLASTPTNVQASSYATPTVITLTWNSVPRATGYEVDIQNPDSSWSALTSNGGVQATTFQATGLTASTQYTFRVEALDAGGASVPSSTVSEYTAPLAPTSVTATPTSSSEIDLSWPAVTGATAYNIYREQGNGGYFFDTSISTTSLADTGLSEGQQYSYKVDAQNSTSVSADTIGSATTYLASPTLTVTGVTTTSVTLHWTNASSLDTGYEIDQQTGPNTWSNVYSGSSLAVNASASTTITGLTEATAYNFRAIADGASSLVSLPISVAADTVPNTPSGLSASPASTTSINLTWTNNSAGADTQLIERSSNGGATWSTISNSVSGSATSYTDTTATEATSYEYRVSAFKGTSQSDYSVSSSVESLPLAPTSLTATANAYNNISLTWTDNSANPTAYRVYRSTNGGSTYSQLGNDLASNATSYTDTQAPENATTYYKVVAVDTGGESAGTAVANTTTPLAAPTNYLAATTTDTSQGDTTINLTWTDVSTVATYVKVERTANQGASWTALATLPANDNSFSDNTAGENTTYMYGVYAVDGNVNSTVSLTNPITTLLSRPTNLTLNSPTSSSVTLNWNPVSGYATSYHVERSTNGVNFTDIQTVSSANASTYTDTGLTEGTTYYYRVRAASGSNTSNYSDVHMITTIPATPTGLTASPFSTTQINLNWTDISTTATAYTVERSTNAGVSWTVVTNALGAMATTFSDTGLTEGTNYEYEVLATGTGGSSLPSATSSTNTVPLGPTSLTTSAPATANTVSLSWTDNSNGATNYEVYRSSNGGVSWTTLTTGLPTGTTSYVDSTAAEATSYEYEVRDNRNSVESAYSNTLNVTTVPATPSGLNITTETSSKVTLVWTDNSNGETGYKVERSSDGGNTWNVVGSLGANSTTYSDSSVTEGVAYSYNVYAYNSGGNSLTSNTVVANILPAAPTALTISSYTSSSVSLSWTNNSSHQTGFYVQRSTNGGSSWTQIANVTSGTTYSDTGLTEATTYTYRVQAYGATGSSAFSGTAQQKTPTIAPTNLAATTVSASEIDLTWTNNSSADSGYSLQISSNGGVSWNTVTLAANSTSYQDTGLTEATTYTYRVQATRSGANSTYDGNITGTTLPAAPSGVTATVNSNTQITVTWTNNSAGATGFTVQRSTNDSTWVTAGTTNGSTTSFADTGRTELTLYYYRVEATGTGGASGYVAANSSVTTLPNPPSNLAATSPSNDEVDLSWTDNSSGATGYLVERQIGGGAFSQIASLSASATTYVDLAVSEATQYTYRVRATASGNNSAYSATSTVTTVPADPSSLSASTISTTQINLSWTNNSAGATANLIERCADGGNTWAQIASVSASATTYNDTGLTEGTDYQYRVRAQDAGGDSFYTNTADATTLPATPSSLVATPTSGQIALTWNDNSNGETSYTVQRKTGGGSWATIANLPADSTSFTDTGSVGGLVSGTTYNYRVFCSDAGGNSGDATANGTAA